MEIISQQERHYLQPGAVCIRFLLAWNERCLSFIKYERQDYIFLNPNSTPIWVFLAKIFIKFLTNKFPIFQFGSTGQSFLNIWLNLIFVSYYMSALLKFFISLLPIVTILQSYLRWGGGALTNAATGEKKKLIFCLILLMDQLLFIHCLYWPFFSFVPACHFFLTPGACIIKIAAIINFLT